MTARALLRAKPTARNSQCSIYPAAGRAGVLTNDASGRPKLSPISIEFLANCTSRGKEASLVQRQTSMQTALNLRAHPRAATRDRRRSEHYYVGRRPEATEVYVVSAAASEPLEHHGYQSSASFDWGAPTAGALELAYAVLAHITESRPPDPICATFCSDVVASLDRSGFVLGHGEVALWLMTAFCHGNEPTVSGWSLSARLRAWRRRR